MQLDISLHMFTYYWVNISCLILTKGNPVAFFVPELAISNTHNLLYTYTNSCTSRSDVYQCLVVQTPMENVSKR